MAAGHRERLVVVQAIDTASDRDLNHENGDTPTGVLYPLNEAGKALETIAGIMENFI